MLTVQVEGLTKRNRPCADVDRRRWSSSIAWGVGFTAVAMAISLFAVPLLFGINSWIVPGDIWMATRAGHHVWDGALGYVYETNHRWYALPLSAILIAPAVGLADHLGLVQGWPFPLARPSEWLVIGPFTLLVGVVLLHAVRRLAWDLGARRRLWVAQVLAVLLVLAPAAQWSHFEDVIALTMVLHALRRMLVGDLTRSALFLAVAIASKQWAMLLIPFLVVRAAPGRRIRCFLLSCSLPGALAVFVLAVDWKHASHALFFPSILPTGDPGHAAFFAHWLGTRTSLVGRVLAVLAAPVLAWKTRHFHRQSGLLAVVAAVFLIRVLLEPYNYSYYWAPALLLACVAGVAAHSQVRWQDWTWPTLAMLWVYPPSSNDFWWWVGEALLLGLAGWRVATICRAPTPALAPALGPAKMSTLRYHSAPVLSDAAP